MPKYAEAPLHKITIRIFAADYRYLIERYGEGYQELVRKFIQEKCEELKNG